MTETTARPAELIRSVTLRALGGCCGSDGRCFCWCHDPREGGNNVNVADLQDDDVSTVCDHIGNGGTWSGHVIWTGPTREYWDPAELGESGPCAGSLCRVADCPPCLDCGTPVHARDGGYHVDGGGVCISCGRARYGDSTEYLFGAVPGYDPR